MFQVTSAIIRDRQTGAGVLPAYIQITPQDGKAITARTNADDGSGAVNFGYPGFQSEEGTVIVFDPSLGHQGATAFLSDLVSKGPQNGITYDVSNARLIVELPLAARPFDVDEAGFIRAQGNGFIREDGSPWLFCGYSIHTLISNIARGDDATAHRQFEYMRANGLNTCWTIGTHLSDWKKTFGFYHDPRHPDHPKQLARLCDIAAEHRKRIAYGLLADADGLTGAEERALWVQDAAVLKDRWNVILYAMGNEDAANGWYPGNLLNQPVDIGRVLFSCGSRGADLTPYAPRPSGWVDLWEGRLWCKGTPDFKAIDDCGSGNRELQAGYMGKNGPVPACPLLVMIEADVYNDTDPDEFGDRRVTDPKFGLKIGVAISSSCGGGSVATTRSLVAQDNGPIAHQCVQEWSRGMWAGFVR